MQSPTASLKKKRRDSKLKDATELAALKLKSKKNVATASCKSDLQNDPNQFEIKQIYASKFAAKHKVQFIATSSLNAIGIDELTSRVGELLLKYTKTYNKLNRISNGGNAINKYDDSSDDENENKNNNSDIFACAVGNCGTGRDRNRYNNEKSIFIIDFIENYIIIWNNNVKYVEFEH